MSKIPYNKELKCKDCKHASGPWTARLFRESHWFRCTSSESWNEEKYDPVFGKTTPGYYNSCGVMRAQFQACGPEANRWTPRNTKLIFLALKNG